MTSEVRLVSLSAWKVEGCDDIGPDDLLSLDCIECEAPPLSSELSVLWQVRDVPVSDDGVG